MGQALNKKGTIKSPDYNIYAELEVSFGFTVMPAIRFYQYAYNSCISHIHLKQ